jgi:two-component system sensor histidine kinase KdpD
VRRDKPNGSRPNGDQPWWGYLPALAGVVATTGIIHLIPGADHIGNISLLYLLVVIGAAYRYGRGPAVLAALLSVLSFDWFFVEPRHTFTVNNPAGWLTLAIFLITALVMSHLTQNLRLRAEEALRRQREAAALSQASWAVASQTSFERMLMEVLRQISSVISCEVAAILVPGANNGIEVVAAQESAGGVLPNFASSEPRQAVEAVLRSSGRSVEACNHNASGDLYLPMAIEQRVLGVLYLRRTGQPLLQEERRVVESLANHAAVALERHRLMQAETQAEALLEADKLKTALLAMVSHDFRSPLAAIKASVTGLLQEGTPWDAVEERELLVGIDQETDRLNRMVGDILTLSRLEAGAWRPQREPVSITEVVGAALDAFSDADNRRIKVDIDPHVPEVPLDSVQLVQVLHNLLDNALKYSAAGTPVELRVRRCNDRVEIAILDRGVGLPAGEEEHIFERFYRASVWRESAVPGTGMGLAICRGLVEAQGGQLTAANREGGGAVFRVALPLQP